MLTTLTNRLLADTTVSYKFFDNKLTIIIDTDAAHNVYGSVNITLANAETQNVYTNAGTLVEDVFNDTFLFTATSTTRLEHSFVMVNGLTPSISEIEMPNDGSDITATVDNLLLSIEKGTYFFKLLDVASTVFDGSLVSIQEQGIAFMDSVKYDGVVEDFDEEGLTSLYESIDGQELTFHFPADITSTIGDTNATNIPLLIING